MEHTDHAVPRNARLIGGHLRIRFDPVKPRHRPEAKKPGEAKPHWRGWGVLGARKRHIRNVSAPVMPGEVAPFLSRAREVLLAMVPGGCGPEWNVEEEISYALRFAEHWLDDHLYRPPPPPQARPEVRALAQACLVRIKKNGRARSQR